MAADPHHEDELQRRLHDLRETSRTARNWLDGLPLRAAKVLMREGFSNVDQVRRAIRDGRLDPAKTMELGPQSFQQICSWAEQVQPSYSPASPEDEAIQRAKVLLEAAGYTVLPPSR